MTIRQKTVVIITSALTAITACALVIFATGVMIRTRNRERLDSARNVSHASFVLANTISELERSATDYAYWDDTRDFVANRNEEYISNNLVDDTFSRNRFSIMIFVDSRGETVFGTAYDPVAKTRTAVAPSLLAMLAPQSPLLRRGDEGPLSGVLVLPDDTLLIASCPIRTSDAEGPSRGTLLIAQPLNNATLRIFIELTDLLPAWSGVSDPGIPVAVRNELLSSTNARPVFVSAPDRRTMVGYALFRDVFNQPAVILQVRSPRHHFERALKDLAVLCLLLIGIGGGAVAVSLALINRLVLARTTQLRDFVSRVTDEGSLSSRVSLSGKDELTELGSAFNRMLDALEYDIAQRKTAEKAARENEQLFRSMFETSPLGIATSTADGHFVRANASFCRMMGRPEEELKALTFKDITHPEDLARDVDAVKSLHEGNIPLYRTEKRYLQKNGTAFWGSLTLSVMRDAQGHFLHFLVMVENVDERKRAEEDLKQSVSLLRATLESTADGILVVDQAGKIADFNARFTQLWGIPREVTDARDDQRALDFVLGQLKDPDAFLSKVRQLYAEPDAESFDLVEFKDGRVFERYSQPQRIDGRPVGRVWSFRDITERRRAEEEVLETEGKYKAVVETTATGYVMLDERGHVIEANAEYVRLSGHRSIDEIRGRSVVEWTAAEDRDRNTEEVRRCLQGYAVTGLEVRYMTPGGGMIPVEIHATTVQTRAGPRILTLCRDITDRKHSEQMLREERARLGSIIRVAPVGIGVIVNRIFTSVNERMCELTGYSASELIGQSFRLVYATDEEFEHVGLEKYRQIAEKGTGAIETRWRRKDGTVINVLLNATPVEADNPQSGVTFTAMDITERLHAEAALRESEERYRGVYEEAPFAFVMWDRNCLVTDWNRQAEQIFGWKREEILGRNFLDFLIPESDRPTVQQVVAQLLEGRLPSHAVNRNLTKSGKVIVCEWNNAIQRDAQGAVTGAISMSTDITEKRRAEEEKRDLQAKMQQTQKLESLGVLAGGIAHDFNNLLMTILGNADLALADLPPKSPVCATVQEIVRGSRRAAELCKQMLAYSGKSRFIVEPTDLTAIVRDLSNMLAVAVSKKALLRYDFADSLPAVEADATQLRQVAMNLILNASDAIGERSGVIGVRTGAMDCDAEFLRSCFLGENLAPGLYVYLEVVDTGCGMDRKVIERIFEPFYTTKFTGRGLGLTAVFGIVRGHRGALRVESQPGHGTTFRVLFPASELGAVRKAVEPEAIEWKGSGTVLVVDDDETVRSLTRRMVERSGFTALTACDGREAVEVFQQRAGEIACVILDLTMPHMDGSEAFVELKKIRDDVRVIMTSGYDEQEVAHRFAGAGVAGFIEKPYNQADLIAALKKVLSPSDGTPS